MSNVFAIIALVFELPTLLSLSFTVEGVWPEELTNVFNFFLLNVQALQNALGNPDVDILLYHVTFWYTFFFIYYVKYNTQKIFCCLIGNNLGLLFCW